MVESELAATSTADEVSCTSPLPSVAISNASYSFEAEEQEIDGLASMIQYENLYNIVVANLKLEKGFLHQIERYSAEHESPAFQVLQQQQQSKYTSLEEVEGRIYIIARDQHGCRFLQRKFDEGSSEDVQKIFVEIIDHIIELMTDPFGNYLVQKLLEVCSEDQRMQILHAITGKPGELVTISLNMHG